MLHVLERGTDSTPLTTPPWDKCAAVCASLCVCFHGHLIKVSPWCASALLFALLTTLNEMLDLHFPLPLPLPIPKMH